MKDSVIVVIQTCKYFFANVYYIVYKEYIRLVYIYKDNIMVYYIYYIRVCASVDVSPCV